MAFIKHSTRVGARGAASLAALALLAAGCSLSSSNGADKSADPGNPSTSGKGSGEVVLLTHNSFDLPKKLVRAFEAETGYTLVHTPAGDGGELTSKIQLTEGDPLGDVVFGIDNTFAAGALDSDALTSYDATLPEGADAYRLDGDDDHLLTPVDTGNVCVNIDDAWFDEHQMDPPTSLADLTRSEYKGLFVTPGATTSTPGFAFLLATIGAYGDAWTGYWKDLLANDAKIVKGWEDAYYVDFSFSGGDRPIVLSYDTSPAYTVDDGASSTSALLDTCFRQVEYAGVLAGAKNPAGAEAVIDWLLSPEVQAELPTSMYVYPVDGSVALPEDWANFAVQPTETLEVSADDIAEHRREWLTDWTDLTTQ